MLNTVRKPSSLRIPPTYFMEVWYSPKTVNRHLSSLRSYNDWLIESARQTETVVLKNDFMKIQLQYASPSTVTKKDVEAFRQRLLESGNKRDYAIVKLLQTFNCHLTKLINRSIT